MGFSRRSGWMAIEIVDLHYLPIKNGGSFHSYVKLPEGMFRGFQQIRFLGEKKVNLSVIKIVVKSDWSLWFRRVKSSSWCFKPCRIHQQLCINDVYLRMIHPLDDGWLINQRSYQVTCKNKKRWWHMMTSQFSDLLKLNGPDNHQPNQHPIKCIHMPNCCLSQH